MAGAIDQVRVHRGLRLVLGHLELTPMHGISHRRTRLRDVGVGGQVFGAERQGMLERAFKGFQTMPGIREHEVQRQSLEAVDSRERQRLPGSRGIMDPVQLAQLRWIEALRSH